MKVKLISSTELAANLAEIAARFKQSSNCDKLSDICQSISSDKVNDNVVKEAFANGDTSALEHVNFCFAVSDISSLAEAFLTSHRLASFTMRNEQESVYDESKMYIPNFKFNSYVNEETKEKAISDYKEFCIEAFNTYKFLLEKGIDKQYAMYVLPSSVKTEVLFSANAKEVVHIINAALQGRGKHNEEIRELGNALLNCIKDKLPTTVGRIEKIDDLETSKLEKLNALFDKEGIACDITDRNLKETVELVEYTEDAEKIIGMTTLINHTNCSTEYAKVRTNDTEFLKEILEIICTEKRARELEMVKYTFRINNLTLSILKDLMSNKISSIAVPALAQIGKSRAHVIPRNISECADESVLKAYNDMFDKSIVLYEKLKEYDVLIEDLIYTYLEGDYVVDIVITMNARELYKFFKYKTCMKTNEEMRNIACLMLDKLKEVSPFIFFNAGPCCYEDGKCISETAECKQKEDIIGKNQK